MILRSIILSLFLAAQLAAWPASATVLFTGAEDMDFTLTGSANFTSSGFGRPSFIRETIYVSNFTTVADPPANRFYTPAFTPASTLWIHAQFYPNIVTTTANEQALIVRSPDGVSRIVVRQTGTNGQLKLSTRNAAGTITDVATASGTFAVTALQELDLYINYTCSGAGGVIMYIAGVQVINYSGNLCTDSATQLDQVDFASVENGNGNNTYWSEIIITDTEDTRGWALLTDPPLAAGNTQSWTPSTDADINKTTINDATFINTTSNNALSEWTVGTTLPSGSWSVVGVSQDARVEASSSSQHFEWLARTGGTDNVTGSIAPPVGGAYSNYQNIWATNPNTGTAWTLSDVTAAGFNLGIESLP